MPSIFHNSQAFAPLYDQLVAVKGAAQSVTLKACVFEDGLDDPLSDASPAADRRHLSVCIPKTGDGGWNCAMPPKRGDTLTVLSWGGVAGVDDFAVERVVDFQDSWQLSAREVQR
jgi:hypothetical protein